jgi:hypothetical protein
MLPPNFKHKLETFLVVDGAALEVPKNTTLVSLAIGNK